MRTVECPCGVVLEGDDDEDLIRKGRVHADEHHANENISDDFIREHVQTNARDGAAHPN